MLPRVLKAVEGAKTAPKPNRRRAAGETPTQPVTTPPNDALEPTLPRFEWVSIGSARVEIADYGVIEFPAFQMAKHPVTAEQFALFITDPGGYADENWWAQVSPDALTWRQSNHRPILPRWVGEKLPRDRVCWFEAMAFCVWFNDRSTTESIRLPHEAEWQFAAQGYEDRAYPWGNEFKEGYATSHANTRESKRRRTVAVHDLPAGITRGTGIFGLSGNVWEWCLNTLAYQEDQFSETMLHGAGPRALRGGSWDYDAEMARVTARIGNPPHLRLGDIGFRVVRNVG
jgi:formylglycine-generating enzyme required for sulfatase activity